EEADTITSFTDRSTESIDITVRFKRGHVKTWTPDKALDYFKLREKTTERIVVIDWNGSIIRTYAEPQKLVRDFVNWRLGWYTKRFQKLVVDDSYERNYWYVLRALFKAGFTKKLGTFANRAVMAEEVTGIATKAKLKLDDQQMDRVLSLATYRWTVEFANEIQGKIDALDAAIIEYKAILKDPDKLKAVYAGELDELKKLK
ncbi:MAG: hypothetical protein EOO77_40480, partial [Oxalobacteraceae bacterium]